jgi:pseudomonalisin
MAASRVATDQEQVSTTTRWTRVLTALCVLSISSRAQNTDLVTAAVDPSTRVALRGQRPPWALPQNIQGAVPGDTMLEHLTLVLQRSPQRQKAFEQFLRQQQDPASPNCHR